MGIPSAHRMLKLLGIDEALFPFGLLTSGHVRIVTLLLSIRNAHGDEIAVRSDTRTTRVQYEYDEMGNWTKRITSRTGQPAMGVWRKVTYW